MFMAMLSMMVSTILLVIPIVSAVGVDPIWFGVFIVLMCEPGLITPPVCVNLFGAQGIRPDKGPVSDVIQGAIPHAVIMIPFAVALTAFPARHLAAGTDAGLTGACRQTAPASVMRPVRGPAGRHLPAGRWRRGRP
jgi:TRAP-type C4-dicarboxylate transport system permease large subunit